VDYYEDGGILVGPGERFSMPASPTGDTFLHWDLNSPDLSNEKQWQGITALRYDVRGENMSSIEESIVQVETVLNVRKPDGSISYFTDFNFHEIPLGKSGSRETYTLDVNALGMPEGTIILKINFRFFFKALSTYDGYIIIDNVTGLFNE